MLFATTKYTSLGIYKYIKFSHTMLSPMQLTYLRLPQNLGLEPKYPIQVNKNPRAPRMVFHLGPFPILTWDLLNVNPKYP